MSSRALRKLQREQELQKQLVAAQPVQDDVQESEEEEEDDHVEPVAVKAQPRNAFDMLEDVQDEDNDDDDSDDERSASVNPPSIHPPSSHAQSTLKPEQPSKSKKKKKKKAKKKQRDPSSASTPAMEESGDEIDKALKELAIDKSNVNGLGDAADSTTNWEASAAHLLAIDPRHLNPTNEMKSLFGSVALEADSRSSSSPRNQNQNQRRRDLNQQGGVDLATGLTGRYSVASRGRELGSLAHRRNILMQGKEEWPLSATGGLGMEHEKDAATFDKKFNIIGNSMYQEAQAEFRQAVTSLDPQRMIAILTIHPYHIATLLQVSEIAKQQGDHSVAADLLERALFNFGRSAHSSFPSAIRDGIARLSFNNPANRELYLTIWRYLRNLEMRGTWKTAFEWAKLLFQLDTTSDPFGVTLMIDQLALRGRSHDQLLKLTSDDAYGPAWRHLPNIQISLVLALLRSKQPRDARKQLALCVHQYPYIISALASALDISPVPKALWAKLPSTDAEKLYMELYVLRAKDLWNTPETSALIVEVADTMSYYSSTIESAAPAPTLEISLEEARHVMLLETPQLVGLLPKRFTNMSTYSFDVLPPPSQDSDFTARAPSAIDASGPSALQAMFNAGAATAGATGNNIMQALTNFRNWFNTPATATDTENGDAENEGRAALFDLQRDLARQGVPPAMVDQFLRAHMFDDADESEDPVTLDGLGMNGTPGDWDYYANRDAGDAREDGRRTPSDMPELEDIPTNQTFPSTSSAQTPPQLAQRNPRAAMVEEGDDDLDLVRLRGSVLDTAAGQPILRHVDSDNEPDSDSEVDMDPRREESTAAQTARLDPPGVQNAVHDQEAQSQSTQPSQPPQANPIPAPSTIQTDSTREDDPQRLQRHLLTTAFAALLADPSHKNVSEYVRQLKILRKQQREWILSMVAQRQIHRNAGSGESGGSGGSGSEVKELVSRIRRELEME